MSGQSTWVRPTLIAIAVGYVVSCCWRRWRGS